MAKQSSEELSSLAARVLNAGNPLEEDASLAYTVGMAAVRFMEEAARNGGAYEAHALGKSLAPYLDHLFADARRLAASVLSQDEKPKAKKTKK